MAHKIHLWIFEMHYTLNDGFRELLHTNCLPPSRIFDQADGEFLLEPHLLIPCDTINLSLQLTHNAVCISHTPGGGFSLIIG
jgi:hypothetical protein